MPQSAPRHRAASGLGRLPIFYGWVVVAIAFVTMGVAVNARTAFSLLYPPILAEFGWSRGVTAAAFSIGFLTSSAFSPIVGMSMDRFGPRYVMPVAAVLTAAGMAMVTVTTEPWHLYLSFGVLVVGGGVFMAYVGHAVFLPNWFVRNRGLAIGIAFSGVGAAAVLLFPWLQALIDTVGWRRACWAMVILLLAVIPLNLLLQRRRPEDIGLGPDGAPPAAEPEPTGKGADNVVDQAWAATEWTLRRAMRTTRFWWVALGFFCGLWLWYSVQVHQTKYLAEIGFSREVAAYALGLVPLMGVAGQIGLGYLSDRIGREWIWTLSAVGYAACYGLLLVMEHRLSPTLMYLMVASQGVLGYGLASVYGAIPVELFQGRRYGEIMGVLSLAGTIGAAAGPWAFGEIYDHMGSYAAAFWLSIAIAFLSILCMWLAAPRKVRVVAGQVARLQRRKGAAGE